MSFHKAVAGGHHRLRQHRHRPDDQDPASDGPLDRGRDGRHRPRVRRAGPRAADGRADHRTKESRACCGCRTSPTSNSSSTPPRLARTAKLGSVRATPGIRMLDLTPACVGPFRVPVVNLDEHLDAPNLNMVTCGGQATVPIVAAVAAAGTSSYAEIVVVDRRKSAGPGTRANIDEFIETTSTALQVVGGARRGKAVMILNPADPPVLMRNTVYCLVDGDADRHAIEDPIPDMVDRVAAYVPGDRLKQGVQFEASSTRPPARTSPKPASSPAPASPCCSKLPAPRTTCPPTPETSTS